MKAFAITLTLCLFNFATIAADSTVVKLMQKIIELKIDKSLSYFYLLETAKNPVFTKESINEIKYDNTKAATELPLEDFLIKVSSDTSTFNWSSFDLPKAKCIDVAHLPKYSDSWRIIRYMPIGTKQSVIDSLGAINQIAVIVKPRSTKKQIENQKKKAVVAFYNSWPIEKRYCYVFSKPIFSEDRKYVMISLELNAGGCHYFFKNNNGNWELVYKGMCIVV